MVAPKNTLITCKGKDFKLSIAVCEKMPLKDQIALYTPHACIVF